MPDELLFTPPSCRMSSWLHKSPRTTLVLLRLSSPFSQKKYSISSSYLLALLSCSKASMVFPLPGPPETPNMRTLSSFLQLRYSWLLISHSQVSVVRCPFRAIIRSLSGMPCKLLRILVTVSFSSKIFVILSSRCALPPKMVIEGK